MRQILQNKLFAIASGLILFSTAAIGILLGRSVLERSSVLEDSLVQSNNRLVSQTLERIEAQILETDRGLYALLPESGPQDAIAKLTGPDFTLPPLIRGYYLCESTGRLLYPLANQSAAAGLFRQKVFPEIRLERIAPMGVYHLHTRINQENYLFSMLKFITGPEGKEFLLVQEFDLDNLDPFFDPFLTELRKTSYVCIRDYDNNVIHGVPFQVSRKYFVEERFPNTFYKWLFQLAPRNAAAIEQEAFNRRLLNLFLGLFILLLILSAWGLVYLSRREETKLTRQKEEFIRNVSHELRTPLSLIKMFSEILLMGRGRNEQTRQEYLSIIFAETERMGFLINNVLDFSNLEKGLQRFCFEEVALGGLVRQQLEVFDYRLKKEKVVLSLEEEKSLPLVRGDRNALAMILLNLLDNAIKYGAESERRVIIRLFAKEGKVCLQVQDNGIGIPVADQMRIFEKFYRSDSMAVRKIRGSGIGLSLVKYLVEAHGGTIRLESETGRGSTFGVCLPALPAPAV